MLQLINVVSNCNDEHFGADLAISAQQKLPEAIILLYYAESSLYLCTVHKQMFIADFARLVKNATIKIAIYGHELQQKFNLTS